MKLLFILDVVMMALAAAMTVSVGFVALAFSIYQHSSVQMAAGLPGVLRITACFLVLLALSAAATVTLRRRLAVHWLFQLATVASLPVLFQIITNNVRN